MEKNMKKDEITVMAWRKMKRGADALVALIDYVETTIDWLVPIIVRGKEATDEWKEFPSDINKEKMERARQDVIDAVEAATKSLTKKYESSGPKTKRLMSSTEFTDLVGARLVSILEEND